MAFTVDTERVKQKIAAIRDKLQEEVNPLLLNEYRLLLKKEIPFFRRSWVAAYLLMLHDQGQSRQISRWEKGEGVRAKTRGPVQNESSRGSYRDNGAERRSQGALTETPYGPVGKFVLNEEESKRLFISIGRNRRLFPREILGLIINTAQVEREDIGSIRILDSYSFVQVRDTVADQIIEALNGAMFRGRTLTVNYAHAKREGGTGDTDGEEAQAPEPETPDTETPEAPIPEAPDLGLGAEEDDDPPDEDGV
ncbi:MAG: DbpA RNA binding domain-containing protein [Treponema sp.]|jgi:hypothetical protein|nr:DbpA RNA binding domain-containing protein [Treponema sp.]